MPFRARGIVREMSAAFAVLLIYVLTLLLPLHQAAGLQRDLEGMGFHAATWSICTPLVQDKDDGNAPTAVKCPIAGIAKNGFAAIEPASIDIGTVHVGEPIFYPGASGMDPLSIRAHTGQPRAPPVSV